MSVSLLTTNSAFTLTISAGARPAEPPPPPPPKTIRGPLYPQTK